MKKFCNLKNDPNLNCKKEDWRKKNCEANYLTQAIVVCYFALTTLSTVGYGDLYPVSVREIILGIIFMLMGIVFFSKIMSQFIDIIQNYNQRMDDGNDNQDSHNWTQMLSRFSPGNKPLQK